MRGCEIKTKAGTFEHRDPGAVLDGTIVSVTVIDKVNSAMRIYHEETFGPFVSIVVVKDKDVIRVANDTEYCLAAAVSGRDGSIHINGPTVQDEVQIPFGGMKASGYVRFGSRASIHEFTELRWITIETKPHHYPF
jgi:acyl-CoA reductase-like NAD-dependent aldehyde dehydrogenase